VRRERDAIAGAQVTPSLGPPRAWVGTSGWNYAHWRGLFYPVDLPTSQWFFYYARVFRTVEINSTFYRLPSRQTFDKWRQQAPEGFLYAVKANRFVTHVKRLREVDKAWEDFSARVLRLGPHLGPILIQLPPHWRVNLVRLEQFFQLLRPGLSVAVEFRDPSWLVDPTYNVLRAHRVALCIHDLLEDHPRIVTAEFVYVRFHGTDRRYGGCYGRAYMRAQAQWLAAQLDEGRSVYVYFNNDAQAYAVRNALELIELLETSG
jgi:uncharacterized protein YecE (DUF72 family)